MARVQRLVVPVPRHEEAPRQRPPHHVHVTCALQPEAVIRLVFRPLVTLAGSKTVKGGAYKGGPLAHLARLADFKFNKDFDPITVGPEMEPMSEEVVSDLSTDQQFGYRLYRMVRSGICPKRGN